MSMTQRRVENTRVNFRTFSPVSVKLKNRAYYEIIIAINDVAGSLKNAFNYYQAKIRP